MRTISRCFLGVSAALAVGVSPGGAAESRTVYRSGTPPVLTPPVLEYDAGNSARHSETIRESFAAAYQNIGSPRLAVFWDRSFGEASDAPPSVLPEISAAQFEAGYSLPFLESGVHFIDRNAIMRLTRAKMLGDRQLVEPGDSRNHHKVLIRVLTMKARANADAVGNRQFIETEALKGYADMVIQISMIPSDESELGVAFRVLAVDVKTGAVKINFLNRAVFPGREQWTAVKGGYIRAAQGRDLNFEDAGHLIAMQTMNELMRIWGRA